MWRKVGNVSLLDSVTAEEMQTARIVTGVTMAAFIGISITPGLRAHAARLRYALLALYLLTCVGFVGYVLQR